MVDSTADISALLTQQAGYGLDAETSAEQQLSPLAQTDFPFLRGDATNDGMLSREDAMAILGDRRDAVSGPEDARDFNNDGVIDILDVRQLGLAIRNNDDLTGPNIVAGLANDTMIDGGSNVDAVTADPSVSGMISDDNLVTRLWGSFDGENFTDVSEGLGTDGSFSLNRPLMEQIYNGFVPDGEHILTLRAQDQWGNTSESTVDFTMNRVLYAVSSENNRSLGLVNTETDDLILLPLDDIEGWAEAEAEMRSTEIRYFESVLTPDQVFIPEGEPDPVAAGVDAMGTMTLVLDPTGEAFGKEGPAVQYTLELFGVDLGGTSTPDTGDDVTAIHLHSGNPGETKVGPHTLNIFGLPGQDDNDAVFDFENNTITGIWDNLDSTDSAGGVNTSDGVPNHHLSDVLSGIDPLSTKTVSDYVDELLAGNFYIQAHTNDFDIPGGVMRGQVEEVSEEEFDGDPVPSSTTGYIESAFLEHTLITPDEQSLYVTVNGSLQIANSIVALDINSIDWEAGTADLSVAKVLRTAEAGEPTNYPVGLAPLNAEQTLQSWPTQAWNQVHGPTIQPKTSIVQFSQWTNDRLFFIDDETKEFVSGYGPLVIEGVTNQTHGVFFNPSGTKAALPDYYWDGYAINLFDVDPETYEISYDRDIILTSEEGNGGFQHFVSWIDDQYAYTMNMQLYATSLTPDGVEIVGPSLWLIDAVNGTAEIVVGTAETADDPGVFRSPSDFIVVGNKLYVAEEDSLDPTFGEDGYVAVYDITDIQNPVFIKRLKPGDGLPADFKIAHGLSPSSDGSAVYVASYLSKYLLKIDTTTDTVVKEYGETDGLISTHGGFAAGASR
ncbi:MAG: CHRD domain-containing protein [Crocosphaera sp.]|nr:CHRD domain-containing protein [Crocosphaera sp.]